MNQKLTITVNSTSKYLRLWNGIFNLTSMEIAVLAALIDINKKEGGDNLCSLENKKAAALALGIEDHHTLNNYVKKFKDKKAIRKEGKLYLLNQLLNIQTESVQINIQWG